VPMIGHSVMGVFNGATMQQQLGGMGSSSGGGTLGGIAHRKLKVRARRSARRARTRPPARRPHAGRTRALPASPRVHAARALARARRSPLRAAARGSASGQSSWDTGAVGARAHLTTAGALRPLASSL
jgi:hypothetical protein